MKDAFCLDDVVRLARRRIPRFAYDFVAGGAGEEAAMGRARAAFRAHSLRPRVLRGCVERSAAADLFGRRYAAPFGVAPIGLADLAWPGTDLALARLAAERDVPAILSTAATTTLEAAAAAARGNLWFQLYVGQDHAIVLDLVDRAAAAGVGELVVTVDVPSPGKRRRDLRNGFGLPLRPGIGMARDLATHPGWALATARAGAPRFANLERYHRGPRSAGSLAQFMASQSSARLDRAVLAELRERWRGRLIVKGVLHPDDARLVQELGADGIVVSSHGGRQLDGAVAPLDALPAIRAAVGAAMPLILDGGIRSGEDVLLAIAAGADFVLLGRPFALSVAALGARGPGRVADLLLDEIDRALAQLGFDGIERLRSGRGELLLAREPAGGAR